jgi:hypothetical protein
MSRLRAALVLTIVLAAGAASVRADSVPVIQGRVSGIELCPQAICRAAIFIGVYAGQVGVNPHALGTMTVAATHDDLPVDGSSAITGGAWRLRLLSGRTITGVITGGELSNPCDDSDNAYCVSVDLAIASGGTGSLTFEGVLSHDVFPPTIVGALSQ